MFTLILDILFLISFGIPVGMATHHYFKESKGSSGSSTEIGSGTVSSVELPSANEQDVTVEDFSPFQENPKIERLLKDPISYKYIQDYLLHYQELLMSDYFNFWNQVKDFKNIKENTMLSGKAYLLYQKFLSDNAYRYIDCCPPDLRKKMQTILDQVASSETEQNLVKPDFFNEAIELVEAKMAKDLFSKFFHSSFYEQYKEASRLNKGLEDVLVK